MTPEPGAADDPPHDFLHFAGFRYWTASLLPAAVGTTLPFWLRPAGFEFRALAAAEFLAATVLIHAGFSFLRAWLDGEETRAWPRLRLMTSSAACIVAGSVLVQHLSVLVPGGALLVWGFMALFTGVLYLVPPFGFRRRIGREIVLCEGFGLLPVLGAYLVQTGDLTRTVYIAALPLFVATGLWVWADELMSLRDDEAAGRGSIAVLFGARLSGRLGTPALSLLLYATLGVAVGTGSLSPVALFALLSVGFALVVVITSWSAYSDTARIARVRKHAGVLHLVVGVVLALSSLP